MKNRQRYLMEHEWANGGGDNGITTFLYNDGGEYILFDIINIIYIFK